MIDISSDLLIKSVPDRYLLIKADAPTFTLLAASDSYLEMTLQTRENLVGRPLFEVFPENPDNEVQSLSVQNDLGTAIGACASTGEDNEMDIFRYDVADQNGVYRERWWKVTHRAIKDAEGIVIAVLNRPEDVTELLAMRAQIQKDETAKKAKITKVGNFFLERISIIALVIFIQFICIGVLTVGLISLDRKTENQKIWYANHVDQQVDRIKTGQEDIKAFIEKTVNEGR